MTHSLRMDLKKELALLHDSYGWDILYNRATQFVQCQCYDVVYRSGDAKCKICHGTGRLTSLERMRVMGHTSSRASLTKTQFGGVSSLEQTFFLDVAASPKKRDRLLVVGWNKDKTPGALQDVYEVIDVDVVRGANGRIIHYKITARVLPDAAVDTQRELNAIPITGRRRLAEGKRYVWPTNKASDTRTSNS